MSGAAVERYYVRGITWRMEVAEVARECDCRDPCIEVVLASAHDAAIAALTAELQQCRPQWRSIDSLPITVTPEDSWAAIHCLMYGPRIGIVMARVWKGTSECVGAAAAHLGGDVIRYWGATHWMPMPAEPEAALKERT